MMITIGALIIGVGVGIVTGLFGVGGGFLITPLLNIVLGVSMPVAVGTGAVQILGVASGALFRRRHEHLTDYKMALVLLGGNMMGVKLGAATVDWLSTLGYISVNGRQVVAVEFVLLLVFIVILVLITAFLLYDTSQANASPEKRVGLFARIKIPPYTDFDTLEEPRLSLVVMSYFGLGFGFLTGLLGIGGGVLMMPALVYLVGMRTHKAAATDVAIIWASSLVATITHATSGNVNLLLAIPLFVGGSIGLQIGVNLYNRCKGPQLRRYFAFVSLAATGLVTFKIVSVLL